MTKPAPADTAFDMANQQLDTAVASFIVSGRFDDALAALKQAKKKLNSAKYQVSRAVPGKEEE